LAQTRLNESLEQRMWFVWFALKFRMILAANEIRVIAKLDQFSESGIR